MAHTYNTPAIILCREDWNGDDARVTLYTSERGKVEAIARGLRKAESKLAAHAEPLTATEVFIVEGRRFPILAGSTVEDRYPMLRQNLSSLTAAGLVARLVDLMTPLESHDERIYALLLGTLGVLSQKNYSGLLAERIAHMFAWKLLTMQGYHPQLRTCLHCGKVTSGELVMLDARRGGLLHKECVGSNHGFSVQAIAFTAVKGLAYMVEAPIADTLRLKAEAGVLSQMHSAVRSFIEERYDVGSTSSFWRVVGS